MGQTVANVRQILRNGDVGHRHITVSWQDNVPKTEFFAERDRYALKNAMFSQSELWSKGVLRTIFGDGTAELQRTSNPDPQWMAFSARQAKSWISQGKNPYFSLEREIHLGGTRVDRYTVDLEVSSQPFELRNGTTEPRHVTLLVESSTQRPIDMQVEQKSQIWFHAKWDYSQINPNVFSVPRLNKLKTYDLDRENARLQMLANEHGPVAKIGNVRVELLQVWKDQSGSATALTATKYPPTKPAPISGQNHLGTFDYGAGSVRSFHRTASSQGRSFEAFFNCKRQDHLPMKLQSQD